MLQILINSRGRSKADEEPGFQACPGKGRRNSRVKPRASPACDRTCDHKQETTTSCAVMHLAFTTEQMIHAFSARV